MQMHAHRCKNCLKQGRNVVWIHGDCQQGNPETHKCPQCGEMVWQKWLVPVAQLPQSVAKVVADNHDVLAWIIFALGMLLLVCAVALYLNEKDKPTA
jgi:sensor domain CHASE-containing protein